MNYPFRHISIRVPWHDTGWDGRVCAKPRFNGSCLKLKRIGEERDDEAEEAVAGRSLNELPREKWPCCVPERAGFMAPFEYTRIVRHPYNHGSDTMHGHFAPTPLRHPPYSAAAVPFYWLLDGSMPDIGLEYGLDIQAEPDLGFKTPWVQSHENQKALLDCFAGHLSSKQPNGSLCFFYAKQVPFVEDSSRRILIGVGRVNHVAPAQEYAYTTKNLTGKIRSMLWELMIRHSIRPGFQDGFLLPYHAAITRASSDPDFDPAEIVAFSPAERLLEFSHASELVTHDGAIDSLLACAESLRKARGVLAGPWDECLNWIDARLGELWKARGPCPGLGAALSAFGVKLGTLVARSLCEKAGENGNPWPLVERMFVDPRKLLSAQLAENVSKILSETWRRLPSDRRALLKLLSRFEMTHEQATALYVQEERKRIGIRVSDAEILANPYLLYELTRLTEGPIDIHAVDRGLFPDAIIRKKHPLPEPSKLDGGADPRRVRALSVKVLEDGADAGNTLLPQDQVVLSVRDMNLNPPCEVNGDLMNVAKDTFGGVINEASLASDGPALQLSRLAQMGALIRSAIERRIKGKRLIVNANWRKILDRQLGSQGALGGEEKSARAEKTAALKELAESRISVLIGPAGTGKTTLLSVLCSQPQIKDGGILLLAPTGKSRVLMEKATNLPAYTIAQFLTPHRYDGVCYRLSDHPAELRGRTVIIDEASMLTEEMLAAVIQALSGVARLILVGDPRQLPPIGAGRPLVDIVKRLAPERVSDIFPRVGTGYAELTVRFRHVGVEREDLQLAEWFSGSRIAPWEDDVFDKIMGAKRSPHVRFEQWNTPDELRQCLLAVLVEELKLESPNDIAGFDTKRGATEWRNGMRFFELGAAKEAENWQILSPVRTGSHGVPDLNRFIHKHFRQQMIDEARKERNRKYPSPMGPEEIVYGDKVINLVNTDPSFPWYRHRRVYPQKAAPYIANGEIGVAIGYFWKNGQKDFRWKLQVEFASQPGYKYDFTSRDFDEDANPILELAYALTVHKSQGSEFGMVFLVLPNPCRLLSRELLYTALTRQKQRVVILHQGPRTELFKYSSDDHSETARRLTNLLAAPFPVEVKGRFFEKTLINRTERGEMMRSKSEVIIAKQLARNGLQYAYEQPLKLGGVTKYPDFTFEIAESGQTYYWEHCGMLSVPSYRRRWEVKLAWYRANGILPYEKGGGPQGSLIITSDGPNGGIDVSQIAKLIKRLLDD